VVLDGHVSNIASLVSMQWGPEGAHRYAASFQLDKADPRLRSGQTAQVIIEGDKVKDALFLPRQVLFDKDGTPVLYVKSGSHFEPREVKISHRTESQITVEGLREGDEVALVSPDTFGKEPAKSAPAGPSVGGGQ